MVVVGRIVNFAFAAEHDALAAGPIVAWCRIDEFVVVTAWFLRQTVLAVFENDPIVREPQPLAAVDAVQS